MITNLTTAFKPALATSATTAQESVSKADNSASSAKAKEYLNILNQNNDKLGKVFSDISKNPLKYAEFAGDVNDTVAVQETDSSYILNFGSGDDTGSFELPKEIIQGLGVNDGKDFADRINSMQSTCQMSPQVATMAVLEEPLTQTANAQDHSRLMGSSGPAEEASDAGRANAASSMPSGKLELRHDGSLITISILAMIHIQEYLLQSAAKTAMDLSDNADEAQKIDNMKRYTTDLTTELNKLSYKDANGKTVQPSVAEAIEAAIIMDNHKGEFPTDLGKYSPYIQYLANHKDEGFDGQLSALRDLKTTLGNITSLLSKDDLDGSGIKMNADGSVALGEYKANSLTDLFMGNVSSGNLTSYADIWNFSTKLTKALAVSIQNFDRRELKHYGSDTLINVDAEHMKFSYADGGFSANDLKGLFGEFDNMSSMAKSVTTRTNGIYSTVTTLIQTYQNMLNSSIRMISDTAIRG